MSLNGSLPRVVCNLFLPFSFTHFSVLPPTSPFVKNCLSQRSVRWLFLTLYKIGFLEVLVLFITNRINQIHGRMVCGFPTCFAFWTSKKGTKDYGDCKKSEKIGLGGLPSRRSYGSHRNVNLEYNVTNNSTTGV